MNKKALIALTAALSFGSVAVASANEEAAKDKPAKAAKGKKGAEKSDKGAEKSDKKGSEKSCGGEKGCGGEKKAGEEQEAYSIEHIATNLIREYRRAAA